MSIADELAQHRRRETAPAQLEPEPEHALFEPQERGQPSQALGRRKFRVKANVIQKNQEEYMYEAWKQVENVKEFNLKQDHLEMAVMALRRA